MSVTSYLSVGPLSVSGALPVMSPRTVVLATADDRLREQLRQALVSLR